jgi:mannose-6-phosphate isomerase-like protein (cupin superfamily)
MESAPHSPSPGREFLTGEGCWITENWNSPADPAVSIARARVEPGLTTQRHRLRGVAEKYVVIAGTGLAVIGDATPVRVQAGAVLTIPPGVPQHITNDGPGDLVFYCVCTPRYTSACYEPLPAVG